MTGAELIAALEDAGTGAAVLAILAEGLDPDADPPTPEALAEWWPECPDAARREAVARLQELARTCEPDAPGDVIERLRFFAYEGVVIRDGGVTAEGPHLFGHWPTDTTGKVIGGGGGWIANPRLIDNLSRRWIEADPRPRHPLAPIVRAWLARPPVVAAESRCDPLLPVVRSVTEATERTAGRLAFGGILDAGDPRPGQLALFPGTDGPRVPILELVDAHGVPTMAQGRGAPLELAVYVAACIMTPYEARARRARLVTTVRELRTFLFGDRWQPGPTGTRPGDWERVRSAALGTDRLWLPLANGDLWRAVAVRKIPGPAVGRGLLDRQVIFDVELPPGSSDGPPIDRPELSRLRRESGPRFRAFLAAHSLAWIPGRTRVPHPGNRRFRVWTRDPSKYPILTAEDRDRLAFGAGWEDRARKEGRQKADAHWEQLPGATILTRTATTQDGRQGWRIVPTEAAEAIRKRRDV